MATKDWKLIAKRANGDFYQSSKTGKKIVIIKLLKGYGIIIDSEIVKISKTKPQVMKKALSYMRKH